MLRSINLVYDAENPTAIAHFRPTSKSVALIRFILGLEQERACLVVAPYGSGKSITAEYSLHAVENRPESAEALKAVGERLVSTDPDLAAQIDSRRQARGRGLVLALHGGCSSLPDALREAARAAFLRLGMNPSARRVVRGTGISAEEVGGIADQIVKETTANGLDRVAIIWDEFGRHLSSAVTEGRTASLVDVQTLAEYCSRSVAVPVTFSLLLHQSLLNYAGSVSQVVRTELKKVEGRFRILAYVDDSKEMYGLIADAAGSPGELGAPSDKEIATAAAASIGYGMFAGMSQPDLEQILRRAYPLTPAVLYLLPRVSARVSQNERTVFNFIYSVRPGGAVKPDLLFDYFSPDMRGDTAIGGTYRQWLETQSALSKLGSDGQRQPVLKTACFLELGLYGERIRVGRERKPRAVCFGSTACAKDCAGTDGGLAVLLLGRDHAADAPSWVVHVSVAARNQVYVAVHDRLTC